MVACNRDIQHLDWLISEGIMAVKCDSVDWFLSLASCSRKACMTDMVIDRCDLKIVHCRSSETTTLLVNSVTFRAQSWHSVYSFIITHTQWQSVFSKLYLDSLQLARCFAVFRCISFFSVLLFFLFFSCFHYFFFSTVAFSHYIFCLHFDVYIRTKTHFLYASPWQRL